MLRIIIGALCSITLMSANAETPYIEGEHYERVTPEVATHTNGKIEVLEIFWYGCHHCFAFEPYLKKWKPALPVIRYLCDPVEICLSNSAFLHL